MNKYLFLLEPGSRWEQATEPFPTKWLSSWVALQTQGGYQLVLGLAGGSSIHPVLQQVLHSESIRLAEVRPLPATPSAEAFHEWLRAYRLQGPWHPDTRLTTEDSAWEKYAEEMGLEVIDSRQTSWPLVKTHLLSLPRRVVHQRRTAETNIRIELVLEGTGQSDIRTGLGFFDHLLDQLARHGGMDVVIRAEGDLHIDEHHTVEDTALALGEAFRLALANKTGLQRYGFCLPMDDCLATVAVDFGGRPWLVWNAEFRRERIGELPTEMFPHFFKSFADAAACNLNLQATGDNEHHKIEALFKAFARAVRMAVRRDLADDRLPSTKEAL
jgi:imidazoleglycerol phosphate dehydratase HisB